jgi:lysophospholipid acyltransferase (LPLAT)-like uncharacterized protein
VKHLGTHQKTERIASSRSGSDHAPKRANRLQHAVARVVFILERILTGTLRWRWQDHASILVPGHGAPVIYCVWHNRLALSMAIFRKGPQRFQPHRRLAAMCSASKDGALLARILENFEVQPVRGSTSRRGRQALLELTRWAEQGYDLAITPDGPRGPCYVLQEGVIGLAQVTGLPIIPVTANLGWSLRARSWDRFHIPLPFSRCDVVMNPPLRVKRDASDQEREAARAWLENCLREGTKDRHLPAVNRSGV